MLKPGHRGNVAVSSDSDCAAVAEVAAVLQVTEFDVFRLAYYRWFGTFAEPEIIDTHFNHFIKSREIPLWIRYFYRTIQRLDRDGQLHTIDTPSQISSDNAVYDRPHAPNRAGNVLLGCCIGGIIGSVVAGIVYLAVLSQHSTGLVCLLPPCY